MIIRNQFDENAPYRCKRCGRGSYSDHYCGFCDYGFWNYIKNRKYDYLYFIIFPSFIAGLWFYLFSIIGWVCLVILLYLQATENKRMRKHFEENLPSEDRSWF